TPTFGPDLLRDFQDDERVVGVAGQRPRDRTQVTDVIANVVVEPVCVLRAQSADDLFRIRDEGEEGAQRGARGDRSERCVVSGQPQIPATLPFAAQGYELGGVGGSEIVTEAVEELDVLIEDDPLIVEAVGHGGVLPSGVWSVVGWIRVRR